MKKLLTKKTYVLYHYVDKTIVEGANPNMSGNCTELTGDCSWLIGNCSGLSGDCTELSGDCSGLSGDLDECEITDEDRVKGVDISDLVRKDY